MAYPLPGMWLLSLYGEAAAYILAVTVFASALAGLVGGDDPWKMCSATLPAVILALSASMLLRLFGPPYIVVVYAW